MGTRAERWLTTIPGLADHALRVEYARTELYAVECPTVAYALDDVCRRAERTDQAAREVMIAFVPVVVDPKHLVRLAEIRSSGQRLGLGALGRLLFCCTAGGHLPPARAQDEDAGKQQAAQGTLSHRDGRPLTLGERRALARSPSREVLARLLRDPHPMVVRLLLANPRVTEQDVVRMAARRPAAAAVAREIAKTWVRQARIRRSLVLNPGTPPAVSAPLLALMARPELRQVAQAMDIPPVVRALAQEIADLRPPPQPADAQSTEPLVLDLDPAELESQ
jgi:hypothetical protein